MGWTSVALGVWLFRDSCNVYAVGSAHGVIVVDAGSGRWLDDLAALPGKPVALLCTHYFRDHSAGAAGAARAGIPVYVPEHEEAIFADPVQHFRQRETYIIYDNLWDLFAPIEGTPIAGTLRDYDRFEIDGVALEVVPLPGVTISQSGLAVTLSDGSRAVFCGEAIHSAGKLARVAPLQYNYNDFNGGVQCFFSARSLRALHADRLFPSLGDPIDADVDDALALLQDNLRRMAAVRPNMTEQLDYLESEPFEKVTDHVWRDRHSTATTWYVVSDSGKVLAIDYGYNRATASAWSGYSKPERRRGLLHGLEGLKRQFGADRIDVVLVSHYHEDHLCGIPVLQRLHGTQCWAPDNFADLLDHPEAHCFPCNWPVPTRVDRRLAPDQPFTWEEYTFTVRPMNGHTRFSALIGFKADGKRFAHTGDQYFFIDDFSSGFEGVRRSQNHVYRNGALVDGYSRSGEWMLAQRPDIVLQGHQAAMFTDAAFFDHIANWPKDYADLHRVIMPLGPDETHFDLDSWGGWIWPYRTHRDSVEPFSVRVTVRNPLPRAARLEFRLVGPTGWRGEEVALNAEAHSEVEATLAITPSGPCRRQPYAVELTAGGRCFGQVAEGLATVGYDRF